MATKSRTSYLDGSWGNKEETRVIETAQALNALGLMHDPFVDSESAIKKGLAYLKGHSVDNNDSLLRIYDTLKRFGQDVHALETRLNLRLYKSNDSGTLQGFGATHRYYPDAVHTAMSMLARYEIPAVLSEDGRRDYLSSEVLKSNWSR